MKLAVSNIAWEVEDDTSVAKILTDLEINQIEFAPSKYIENFRDFDFAAFINSVKKWEDYGIEVRSMQSLLFGLQDHTLFGDKDQQIKLKDHLLRLNAVSNMCNIGPLVFGSPKNRNRSQIDEEDAKIAATIFFQDLAFNWEDGTSFLVIESNPTEYGCNFLTNTSEAFEFVSAINNDKIRNHIDFACTELGGEDPVQLALKLGKNASHIHLSEKNLGPLKIEKKEKYRKFLHNLKNVGYDGIVTLEMLAPRNLQNLKQTILLFKEVMEN